MITRADIQETSTTKTPRAFCFRVFYNNREYPNFVSCAYRTRVGATRKLNRFKRTGEFSLYGNAE